jgi:hypothetical protein
MLNSGLALGMFCAASVCAIGLEAWAQAPTEVTAEHKELAKLAGTWDTVMKGGPTETKGTATFTVECGGLWVASDFKTSDDSFSGRGMDSYNATTKKYISVWFDSMSTSPLIFEGTWDEATNTMTQTADGKGPNGEKIKFKSVTKHPDDNHMEFVLYMVGDSDVKLVSVDYTRRK